MKSSTILIPGFFFLSILMTSCYYDCDESKLPRNTYLLPNDAKAAFAYNGNDTIRFLKNNRDTVVFISEKIDTFFREVEAIRECDGETAIYEGYKIIFNSAENSKINVSLYFSESNPSNIGVSISYDNIIDFSFNYLKTKEPPDIDSMIINGNVYYDIYYIKNFDETILLYNKEFGILKLTSNAVKLEIL